MQSRRDQQPTLSMAGPSLARTAGAVGTLPAFVYGAAIEGIVGAALGLVLWGLLCALAAGIHRLRVRRRTGADTSLTDTSPTDTSSTEAALFEQLRMAPCAVCGAPTLLDACLDCRGDWSPPARRRWDDAAHRDEPDDPVR